MRSRFVCARVTQMNGVDIARFAFDYDTTWSAFFVDADFNIYSRYGGRDDNVADSRLGRESLLQTMQEVLDTHARARDLDAAARLALLHPSPETKAVPEEIPLLRANHEGCLHCHQIREYRLLQSARDQTFGARDLFIYPLPENVGIRFDRKHGHRIGETFADSPAARAGLRTGDVVTRINDVPVHSEYDFRWGLERAPDDRPLLLTVSRADGDKPAEAVNVALRPEGKWRQTELNWRKSLRSVPFPLGFIGYALGAEEVRKSGRPADRLAIKVLSVRGEGLAKNLDLQKGDVITSIADRQAARSFDQFKSDLLRLYTPGDDVVCTVLRAGEPKELKGKFPNWHTTETSVP